MGNGHSPSVAAACAFLLSGSLLMIASPLERIALETDASPVPVLILWLGILLLIAGLVFLILSLVRDNKKE